jgi:hypothetical protein
MNTVNYSQPDKSLFASGGLAELVDAYALGAYDFGHESSSLLSPTKSRLVVELVSTPDLLVTKTSESNNTRRYKFVARDVANDKDVAKVSKEKLSWAWFFRKWLVLGKNHPTHIHSLLHILLQHQRLFFKQSMYALVNSFCNKCNKTTSLLYFYCNKNHQCMYLTLRTRTL